MTGRMQPAMPAASRVQPLAFRSQPLRLVPAGTIGIRRTAGCTALQYIGKVSDVSVHRLIGRHDRPGADPSFYRCDIRVCELGRLRRHGAGNLCCAFVTDQLDEQASGRISRDDDLAAVSAFKETGAGRHAELATMIDAGVAAETVLLKDGLDVARVELRTGGIVCASGNGRRGLVDGVAAKDGHCHDGKPEAAEEASHCTHINRRVYGTLFVTYRMRLMELA